MRYAAILLAVCLGCEPEAAECPDVSALAERVDALEVENAAQWEEWQTTDAELRAWLGSLTCTCGEGR